MRKLTLPELSEDYRWRVVAGTDAAPWGAVVLEQFERVEQPIPAVYRTVPLRPYWTNRTKEELVTPAWIRIEERWVMRSSRILAHTVNPDEVDTETHRKLLEEDGYRLEELAGLDWTVRKSALYHSIDHGLYGDYYIRPWPNTPQSIEDAAKIVYNKYKKEHDAAAALADEETRREAFWGTYAGKYPPKEYHKATD